MLTLDACMSVAALVAVTRPPAQDQSGEAWFEDFQLAIGAAKLASDGRHAEAIGEVDHLLGRWKAV